MEGCYIQYDGLQGYRCVVKECLLSVGFVTPICVVNAKVNHSGRNGIPNILRVNSGESISSIGTTLWYRDYVGLK